MFLLEMGRGREAAESAIRISLSVENTMSEIQQFQQIVQEVIPKII
ncbi:hypothetical protein GCM10020331_031650 [Ectobacillus funiculus]